MEWDRKGNFFFFWSRKSDDLTKLNKRWQDYCHSGDSTVYWNILIAIICKIHSVLYTHGRYQQSKRCGCRICQDSANAIWIFRYLFILEPVGYTHILQPHCTLEVCSSLCWYIWEINGARSCPQTGSCYQENKQTPQTKMAPPPHMFWLVGYLLVPWSHWKRAKLL